MDREKMIKTASMYRRLFGVDRMWRELNDNIAIGLITRDEAQFIAEKARQIVEKESRIYHFL